MANHREQDRYGQVLHELREMRAELVRENTATNVYSKDFIYFAISMFIPVGYGEIDLIPHDSIAHPIVGWICWAIPVYLGLRMLWHWLVTKQARLAVNIAVIAILGVGFCAGAFFSLRLWVERKHQEEQEELARNLTARVLAPITENPMESVFSITNGSSRTTIADGMLFCGINRIHGWGKNRPVTIGKLSTTAVPNASRMVPGDSRSEPCLMLWSQLVEKAQCVDMGLWLQYVIETQPSMVQRKEFRLVGWQARGGTFNWYPEPFGGGLDAPGNMDYCDYFSRQTAPPPN